MKPNEETKHRLDEKFEAMRPAIQKALADLETILPTESPTSKGRGGNKTQPSDDLINAISDIIEAGKGGEYEDSEKAFQLAMQNADPAFFVLMAEAMKYVREIAQRGSLYSKHLIAIRHELANSIQTGNPKPSFKEIKPAVIKQLGQIAFTDSSPQWSRLKKEVGKSHFSP